MIRTQHNAMIIYDDDKHSFIVKKKKEDIERIIPYLLSDKDREGNLFNENHTEYEYMIFYKKDVIENEIYEIHEKNLPGPIKRIGWLFPIRSLISTSHDYAQNPHYCRYAFVAYRKLIDKFYLEKKEGNLIDKKFEEIINDDFEDALLFIYKKELTKEIPDFKVGNYYPSFYKYGYYLSIADSNLTEIPLPERSITIHQISSDLTSNPINNEFLDKFFKSLYFENDPRLKFHILYQIIELLIEDILIHSLENIIQSFKDKKIYTRSLQDKIKKIEPEKDRINKLMEWCHMNSNNNDNLHDKCIAFLSSKKRLQVDFPESLYNFRNFIVHDFRHMADDIETVREINFEFELFIFDLLISYKHKTD
ncbi:hypothetical protein EZS27_025647 [termite gut metagenome]|uniref:Uncharacterized protein n=1 Tax=termite gut metagenome TaxID=433724 RepID=A0A5J4QW57_9ZZZZ